MTRYIVFIFLLLFASACFRSNKVSEDASNKAGTSGHAGTAEKGDAGGTSGFGETGDAIATDTGADTGGEGGASGVGGSNPSGTGGADGGNGGSGDSGCVCSDDICTSISQVWYDSASNLSWEITPWEYMTRGWQFADDYCNGLTLCGHDDWRLPTISELRSLIRGCTDTQTGGFCGVTDSCISGLWSDSCFTYECAVCSKGQGPSAGGCYWPTQIEGDCDSYWSASPRLDADNTVINYKYMWRVNFYNGAVGYFNAPGSDRVRCVRGGP
jgi:hypothetical protein